MEFPELRCVVVEEGARCNRVHILTNHAQIRAYPGSRYICDGHRQRGYAWLYALLQDPTLRDQIPDLPTSVSDLYFRSGENGASQVLHGWGVVQSFYHRDPRTGEEVLEDQLMLRLDEAKDRQAPLVERRKKTILTGFASPPPPNDDDL